jgi:hypothetical protein
MTGWIDAVQVFDPRVGGDRKFVIGRPKRHVSTLATGHWALEGPSIVWTAHSDLLTKGITLAGGKAFVTFLPWSPNIPSKVDCFRAAFSEVRDTGGPLIGHEPLGENLIPKVWAAQAAIGAATGLWSFGSTDSVDGLAANVRALGSEANSPIFLAAGALPSIGFALCLDDGLDMMFVRLTSTTAPVVDELANRFRRPAE